MVLTQDVVKDLVTLLTQQGFSTEVAEDIIALAAHDVEWAVSTVSKAIMRTADSSNLIAI